MLSTRSQYFDLSILRYCCFRPKRLISPELSPVMMQEPSLFQTHRFWAFLVAFSWVTGASKLRVRSQRSRQPSLLQVAKREGLVGCQLTSQMQSSEPQKVQMDLLESGCHSLTVQSQELVRIRLSSALYSEGELMEIPLIGPSCSLYISTPSPALLWTAVLYIAPLKDPMQQLLGSPWGNLQHLILMSWLLSVLLLQKYDRESQVLLPTSWVDLMGLLNLCRSHTHMAPSLEQETMLLAIFVPTTLREQMGYLWELEETAVLWDGVGLSRRSQTMICPFSHPPITMDLEQGQNMEEVTDDWQCRQNSARFLRDGSQSRTSPTWSLMLPSSFWLQEARKSQLIYGDQSRSVTTRLVVQFGSANDNNLVITQDYCFA